MLSADNFTFLKLISLCNSNSVLNIIRIIILSITIIQFHLNSNRCKCIENILIEVVIVFERLLKLEYNFYLKKIIVILIAWILHLFIEL